MKGKFPGHFTTATSNPNLWDNCIFVFDANILLNLYRYSDETRTLFLKTLEGIQDRIWIPYRVAVEYLDNRLDVIHEQQEEYEKATADINKLKTKLENSRQHPFVSSDTMNDVSKILDKACLELSKNKEIHSKRINTDEIKDTISAIFTDNRIGEALDNDRLEELIKEGAERYKQRIPPGYSDIKKQSTEDSLTARCRPYGDLIIWKAILEKAKQDNSPVIFVTDDGKEDWWLRFKGRTLGPRPELIEEFRTEVNQEFHMYLPERFLSFATERTQENLSEEIVDEIRDIRTKEQDQSIPSLKKSYSKAHRNFWNSNFYKNISTINENRAQLNSGDLELELDEILDAIDDYQEQANRLRAVGREILESHSDSLIEASETEAFLSLKAEHEMITNHLAVLKTRREEISRQLSSIYQEIRSGKEP